MAILVIAIENNQFLCVLNAGNMERLAMSNAHQKSDDPMRAYHLSQKKALEINPRHPLIKGKLFYYIDRVFF